MDPVILVFLIIFGICMISFTIIAVAKTVTKHKENNDENSKKIDKRQ